MCRRYHGLPGADHLGVYLTCYQVLFAAQDARADALLDKAHRLLHERAARISDIALRQSFLECVPAHQALEAVWNAHPATADHSS
jgi:hypothetical protein